MEIRPWGSVLRKAVATLYPWRHPVNLDRGRVKTVAWWPLLWTR